MRTEHGKSRAVFCNSNQQIPKERSIMVLILHTQRTVRSFVPILEMILFGVGGR